MIKIKNIRIKAFRGIPDLDLALDGKSLLLKGDNGTGKSSIVDSLEFVFTGKIAHLEEIQSLDAETHIPHVDYPAKDLDVCLTFDPGSVVVEKKSFSSFTVPEILSAYFRTAQTKTFILKRSQVLALIASRPGERFAAIGSIMGIDFLDDQELEMKSARDKASADLEATKYIISQYFKDISSAVGTPVINLQDALYALNKMLSGEGMKELSSLKGGNSYVSSILRNVRKSHSSEKASLLDNLKLELNNELIPKEIINKTNELNDSLKKLFGVDTERNILFLRLAELGKNFLETGSETVCPICEQKIDPDGLILDLSRRIEKFRAISDCASNVRQKATSLSRVLDSTILNLTNLTYKIVKFTELSSENQRLLDVKVELTKMKSEVDEAEKLVLKSKIKPIDESIRTAEEIKKNLLIKSDTLLKELSLTESETKDVSLSATISRTCVIAENIRSKESQLEKQKQIYQITNDIYSSFGTVKTVKIQNVYSEIRDSIEKFYSFLHPNDAHKNIELQVSRKKRASTDLKIESFGKKGEDPRGFESEGHLDSLGLCIFLAFIKRFNGSLPLMILDDVVATIDSDHRQRIADLLMEEFADKQIIITTHDEAWYRELVATQRKYGKESYFVNLIITGWSRNLGISLLSYKPQWEKIKDYIRTGDKTGAGNAGRQYLESVLQELSETTRTPVPFKISGNLDVFDLYDPLKRRLKLLIADSDFSLKVERAFRDLSSTSYMGNLLSHKNRLADQFAINEIENFCNSVRYLEKLFCCPSCNHQIKYFPDLGELICSNKKCSNKSIIKTK